MSNPKITYNDTIYRNDGLYPRTVILEKGADRVVLVLKPGNSVNTKVGLYAGYTLSTEVGNFLTKKEILKQAAVLDTETLGKGRGSTITELAILYNQGGKKKLEVLTPELDFLIKKQVPLEVGARSSAADSFVSLRRVAPELFEAVGDSKAVLDNTLDLQYLKLLLEGSVGKKISETPLTGTTARIKEVNAAFERIFQNT